MAGGKQADIDLKENKFLFKFVKNLSYSDIWLHNYKIKILELFFHIYWNLRSFTQLYSAA